MIHVEDLNIGDIVARNPANVMWLVVSKRQPLPGVGGRPIVQLMDVITFKVYNVQNYLDDNIIRIAGDSV